MPDPIRVTPESLGLDHVPKGDMRRTYLDNWRITVGSLDLALAIVEDDPSHRPEPMRWKQ